MFNSLSRTVAAYPRQFWLLFGGMLVNSAGASLIWPFLTIYIRERLNLPLTTVTLLLTLQTVTGLVATSVAGPAMDRLGRKGIMVFGLAGSSALLLAMDRTIALLPFVSVVAAYGGLNPLYRIGTNTMIADLLEPDRRIDAYALLRTANNTGVAIGPAIGGFIAVVSYRLAFNLSALTHLSFSLLIAFFIRETLRRDSADMQASGPSSYGPVLRDKPFMLYILFLVITTLPMTSTFVLLPVYLKENFGILESQFGFMITINATLVVVLQYAVTRVTRRFAPLPVLAVGAVLFALGAGSFALGTVFLAFVASIVVLTFGEMVSVPTSTGLTANLAPPDMRARYMGVHALLWGISAGIGPVIGGLLNDLIAPVAIWYGMLVVGFIGAAGFIWLDRSPRRREAWSQTGVHAPGRAGNPLRANPVSSETHPPA